MILLYFDIFYAFLNYELFEKIFISYIIYYWNETCHQPAKEWWGRRVLFLVRDFLNFENKFLFGR